MERLTKSRLEEFKHFLSYYVHSVVFLSETHWDDSFNVQFSSYKVIQKIRTNKRGGGVAILFHNSVKFSPLPPLGDRFPSIEVAISISTSTLPSLDLISVNVPTGDSATGVIISLFSRSNPFIAGGDFNANHGMWESRCSQNRGRNSIWSMMEKPDVVLFTPPDFNTRIYPSIGKPLTIDLIFSSSAISLSIGLTIGPTLGSDQFPILITTDEFAAPVSGRPPRWIFKEDISQITTRLEE